ncbi:hypothetical protein M378DRAFT_174440 [Amanita muscaria Koide BX008]|uniref:Uncharacterized protein n=1 Tax=Amanita muscaria (strain Koide BX008) TaxID=946122 RepID=A0A0C2VZ59_AMAMK|nr:hypothetical protein M378DRAFT_174440 [Amanita muscaria Koide BX008]
MSFRKKIVMVSDWGCGKTSLATRMTMGNFSGEHSPNLHVNFFAEGEVDGKHIELVLWEVVVLEEYERMRPLNYPNSHVVLICFAVDDPTSLENASDKWICEVQQYCPGIPIILLGCKMDLRDNTNAVEGREVVTQQLITPEEGQAVAQKIGAKYYLECSAKTGDGVSEVFQHAARAALEQKKKCVKMCVVV